MQKVQLSAGNIEFTDTGGPGEVVVLVPGLGFDETVWSEVERQLAPDFRVIVPVLPIGGHRLPMNADADLSAEGVAALLGEFLERLDLKAVTVVQNDAGTAQLLVGVDDKRIARLVLTSCEALENYPPGFQGKVLYAASSTRAGLFLLLQSFKVPVLVRMKTSLGGMAARPIPQESIRRWYRPLHTSAAIRRDLRKFVRGGKKDVYRRAAERLRTFDRPALVAWGAEDRMMPPATGRRLAELLPQGRYVEIPGAATLVQWDNPEALAAELRRFIAENPAAG
jgi:pimeloyl-ACP methyl ester carboxylesterase